MRQISSAYFWLIEKYMKKKCNNYRKIERKREQFICIYQSTRKKRDTKWNFNRKLMMLNNQRENKFIWQYLVCTQKISKSYRWVFNWRCHIVNIDHLILQILKKRKSWRRMRSMNRLVFARKILIFLRISSR